MTGCLHQVAGVMTGITSYVRRGGIVASAVAAACETVRNDEGIGRSAHPFVVDNDQSHSTASAEQRPSRVHKDGTR